MMSSRTAGAVFRDGSWPWLLLPPVSVVVCLLCWHNVLAVFAVYHVGFCLLLPAADSLLRRRCSLAAHFHLLGLTGPGTGRALLQGLGLGAVLAAGTILVFRRLGGVFLADHDIPAVLAVWGVDQARLPLLFWFMVLANGPAEELYWRGFVQSRMSGMRQRGRAISVAAVCYASFHGVTVYLLVANLPVVVFFLAVILAAGILWGWLRERTGSVWPPLLGHTGAVIGYMVVAAPLLGR